jgi:hypothetical protein
LTELLVETGAEDGVIEGAQESARRRDRFLSPFYYARPGRFMADRAKSAQHTVQVRAGAACVESASARRGFQ